MNESNQTATSHGGSPIKSRRPLLIVGAVVALLVLLLLGVFMFPRGMTPGTRLLYEVDGPAPVANVVQPLRRRLDGMTNVRVEVQAVEPRRVEVLVTSRDQTTLDHAKQLIESTGVLRFLILANLDDHASLIESAKKQASSDSTKTKSREVHDQRGSTIGRWVTVSRMNGVEESRRPLRVDISNGTVRRGDTGEIVSLPAEVRGEDAKVRIAQWMNDQGIKSLEVLMAVDPDRQVSGSELAFAGPTFDQNGMPAVAFTLNDKGSGRMFALTTNNAPEGALQRRLGIVLDDVLLTAPTIRGAIKDQGQIAGDFTQAEVDLIVGILKAGQMPARVREVPGSQTPVEMPSALADMFR